MTTSGLHSDAEASRSPDVPAPLERAFAARPDLFALLRRFVGRHWTEGFTDPFVLELCRLRIAQLHRCESELLVRYETPAIAGIDEELVSELSRYAQSDRFSAFERACINLAEKVAIDVHSVTDDDFAAVAQQLCPADMVAFVSSLAMFDSLARLRGVLGVEPDVADVRRHPDPDPERGSLH